jgi:hypothetical protein
VLELQEESTENTKVVHKAMKINFPEEASRDDLEMVFQMLDCRNRDSIHFGYLKDWVEEMGDNIDPFDESSYFARSQPRRVLPTHCMWTRSWAMRQLACKLWHSHSERRLKYLAI